VNNTEQAALLGERLAEELLQAGAASLMQ
jgi:hypothetical protein